jgi:hypothetical protein
MVSVKTWVGYGVGFFAVLLIGLLADGDLILALSQSERQASDPKIFETLMLWLQELGIGKEESQACARDLQSNGFNSLETLPYLSASTGSADSLTVSHEGSKGLALPLPEHCALPIIADAATQALSLADWISALGVHPSSAARYAVLLNTAGIHYSPTADSTEVTIATSAFGTGGGADGDTADPEDGIEILMTAEGLNIMSRLRFVDRDAYTIARAAARRLHPMKTSGAGGGAAAVAGVTVTTATRSSSNDDGPVMVVFPGGAGAGASVISRVGQREGVFNRREGVFNQLKGVAVPITDDLGLRPPSLVASPSSSGGGGAATAGSGDADTRDVGAHGKKVVIAASSKGRGMVDFGCPGHSGGAPGGSTQGGEQVPSKGSQCVEVFHRYLYV